MKLQSGMWKLPQTVIAGRYRFMQSGIKPASKQDKRWMTVVQERIVWIRDPVRDTQYNRTAIPYESYVHRDNAIRSPLLVLITRDCYRDSLKRTYLIRHCGEHKNEIKLARFDAYYSITVHCETAMDGYRGNDQRTETVNRFIDA